MKGCNVPAVVAEGLRMLNDIGDGLYLGDGDWISWDNFGEYADASSRLEELEFEARLRWSRDEKESVMEAYLRSLLGLAKAFYHETGRHLQVYGEIGELFGAAAFGIRLNRPMAQGADGRLGNDHVEIKTITPFKGTDEVRVRTSGNFSKVLIVRIDLKFRVSGRMVARKDLRRVVGNHFVIKWSDTAASA